MLFLLNETILDLGEPASTFAALAGKSAVRASLGHAVRAAQELVFAAGTFAECHIDVRRAIAAEIACASEANAALFVRPPLARGQADVAVRLASAPLTTMALMLRHQDIHGPSASVANGYVWNLANPTVAA